MAVKADRDCDSETRVTHRDTLGGSAPNGYIWVYNDAAIRMLNLTINRRNRESISEYGFGIALRRSGWE